MKRVRPVGASGKLGQYKLLSRLQAAAKHRRVVLVLGDDQVDVGHGADEGLPDRSEGIPVLRPEYTQYKASFSMAGARSSPTPAPACSVRCRALIAAEWYHGVRIRRCDRLVGALLTRPNSAAPESMSIGLQH